MKAVILAAGRGERLSPHTKDCPKPLIPILDKPLLEHVMDTLKQAGIGESIIVTGYLGKAIQRYFGRGRGLNVRIPYAHNPVHVRGNATSLLAAKKFLKRDEAFLLLMADHLIDAEIVRRALKNVERRPLLCVDYKPRYPPQIKDATKVFVDSDGYIRNIGKNIPFYNGVDTGVFLLNTTIFNVVRDVEGQAYPFTLSRCMRRLIEDQPLWACDVSGLFWLDIDTLEDLAFACEAMGI